MTVLEVLKEPIFLLPKFNDKDTFPTLLAETTNKFLETIEKVDEGSIAENLIEHKDTLNTFCNFLNKSIGTYYSGFPAQAYNEFEEGIKLIEKFLFPNQSFSIAKQQFVPYYRARIGTNIQYSKNEMFHIPFEDREYVSTQRFSVPGLPCLYLSNSIYVCWEELGRPNINKLQVSRMELETQKLEFLDLSITPSYLVQILEAIKQRDSLKYDKEEQVISSFDPFILNYLMKWPLVAACSIKVRKQNASFKPEYIFSQFLMQWVTKNKRIDGIKYFSIEGNISSKIDYSKLINYAIPAKDVQPSGLCQKLKESFSLTEPISWDSLTMINPNIATPNEEKLNKVLHKLGSDNLLAILEFVQGKKMYYWRTVFGLIEIELAEMEIKRI